MSLPRRGGYPRHWWRDGFYFDGERVVPDDGVDAYQSQWREAGVRVEWLRSLHGHLDAVLPQTLERQAHNQNIRSWVEHGTGVALRSSRHE